ncbi:MAG: hypothetical protein HXY28_02325 [Hydrogenophilaceae bacterium]|jgi:hypothetical protein|nr:hypothetical protein [Hydrogenophilaceae bacterium]
MQPEATPIERFVIFSFLTDVGVPTERAATLVLSIRCTSRHETGAGFFATFSTSIPELVAAFQNSAASKTFRMRTTRELLLFDLYPTQADQFEVEGAVVGPHWPPHLAPEDLEEA